MFYQLNFTANVTPPIITTPKYAHSAIRFGMKLAGIEAIALNPSNFKGAPVCTLKK